MKKLQHIIFPSFLILISLICAYANAFKNTFMMDDLTLMRATNSMNIWEFFWHPLNGYFRPLPNVLFKTCVLLFKFNPFLYSIFNFSLYFVICILVYVLVKELLLITHSMKNNENSSNVNMLAFVTAIFYSVHPINAMLVNYKSASMLAVYVIFCELSFLNLLISLKLRSKLHYSLTFILYVLALLTHEFTVVLPIFFLVTFLIISRKEAKNYLILFFPFFITTILYGLLYLKISQRNYFTQNLLSVSFLSQISAIGELLKWYIMKLCIPWRIIFLWNTKLENSGSLVCLTGLLGLCIGVMYLFVILKKLDKKLELIALSMFTIGFLPLSVAAFTYTPLFSTALIEPHWFYFSSIGFFILMASAFEFLVKQLTTIFKIFFLSLIIIFYIMTTRQSNLVWHDTQSYCLYWISENNLNFMPYLYLQRVYLQQSRDQFCLQGRVDACSRFIDFFIKSSNDSYTYLQLARTYTTLGFIDIAQDLLHNCIRLYPGFLDAYLLMGTILVNHGFVDEGIAYWNRGLIIDPSNHTLRLKLAMLQKSINKK